MINFYVNTLYYLVYLNIDFNFHCLAELRTIAVRGKRENFSTSQKRNHFLRLV